RRGEEGPLCSEELFLSYFSSCCANQPSHYKDCAQESQRCSQSFSELEPCYHVRAECVISQEDACIIHRNRQSKRYQDQAHSKDSLPHGLTIFRERPQ